MMEIEEASLTAPMKYIEASDCLYEGYRACKNRNIMECSCGISE